MTRSFVSRGRDLKRNDVIGGDGLVGKRSDLDGQRALGPVGFDDQLVGLLAVDEGDGQGRQRISRAGRRPIGSAARSARRRNRGCAGSPGPARACPAGRLGERRCPARPRRPRSARRPPARRGSARPARDTPAPSHRARPAPSSGRRKRRRRRTARSRRTATGSCSSAQASRVSSAADRGPFCRLGDRDQLAAEAELLDRAAVDRPAPRPSARRMSWSTACDRLIGASRLMLRDSSSRKTAVGRRARCVSPADSRRVEQDQDQNAQRPRPAAPAGPCFGHSVPRRTGTPGPASPRGRAASDKIELAVMRM